MGFIPAKARQWSESVTALPQKTTWKVPPLCHQTDTRSPLLSQTSDTPSSFHKAGIVRRGAGLKIHSQALVGAFGLGSC